MKRLAALLFCVSLCVYADTPVTANQGKPGNQGPWPVTVVNGSGSDGGFTPVSSSPCSILTQTNTSVGAAATTVPATPQTGRIWIQVCNSILNSSSAQCICESDGQPTFASTSKGDVLATGDCATYNITTLDGGVPWCICNGAGIRLPATECVP